MNSLLNSPGSTKTRTPMVFVTGVDEIFFNQIFLLLGSLQRSSPGISLYVCDFGLSERQREFLRQKRMLLEVPAGIGNRRHVWEYKAALVRYVADLHAECVVWLDADLIALSDIAALMGELNARMQQDIHTVAAPSVGTIEEQLAVGLRTNAPHYARLVAECGPDIAYLSSGIFLCRSAELLSRWEQITLMMPLELLYEQNAFNLAARESAQSIRLMEPLIWNPSGQDMHLVTAERSGPSLAVSGPKGKCHILHVTSTNRARDLVLFGLTFRFDGIEYSPQIRMMRYPEVVFEYQQEIIKEAILADFRLLAACGLCSPSKV